MYKVKVICLDEYRAFLYFHCIRCISKVRVKCTVTWYTSMEISKLHDRLCIQELMFDIISYKVEEIKHAD